MAVCITISAALEALIQILFITIADVCIIKIRTVKQSVMILFLGDFTKLVEFSVMSAIFNRRMDQLVSQNTSFLLFLVFQLFTDFYSFCLVYIFPFFSVSFSCLETLPHIAAHFLVHNSLRHMNRDACRS